MAAIPKNIIEMIINAGVDMAKAHRDEGFQHGRDEAAGLRMSISRRLALDGSDESWERFRSTVYRAGMYMPDRHD